MGASAVSVECRYKPPEGRFGACVDERDRGEGEGECVGEEEWRPRGRRVTERVWARVYDRLYTHDRFSSLMFMVSPPV